MRIKKMYQGMSPEAKQSFWTIISNIFLVAFTFWMGIEVQDMVASRNEKYSSRMARIEYIDRVQPRYDTLVNKYHTQMTFMANFMDDFTNEGMSFSDKNYKFPQEVVNSISPDSLITFYHDVLELGASYRTIVFNKKNQTKIDSKISDLSASLALINCFHPIRFDGEDSYNESEIRDRVYESFFSPQWKRYTGGVQTKVERISEMAIELYHQYKNSPDLIALADRVKVSFKDSLLGESFVFLSPLYWAGLGQRAYKDALEILLILEEELSFKNIEEKKGITPSIFFLLSLIVFYIIARLFASTIVKTNQYDSRAKQMIESLQSTIDRLAAENKELKEKLGKQ